MYNYAYRDSIYTIIEEKMKDKKTEKELLKIIKRYMDMNASILNSVDFSRKLLFSNSIKLSISKLFGNIDKKFVKKAADKSSYIDKSWFVTTNPTYVILTSVIIYYLLNKGEDLKIRMVLYFLTMPIFSSTMSQFFKTGVNKEIMDYTIANLTQKNYIKTEGSIIKMLGKTAEVTLVAYRDDLKEIKDKESYLIFISGLETRISKNIKNIAKKYYENYEKGNYLNTDTDNLDEENYRIISSDTLRVSTLATKTSMNLSTIGFDSRIVKQAKNLSRDVNINKLYGFLDSIVVDHKEDLREFIIRLIEILYIKGYTVDDAKSPVFLKVGIEAYRSNSDDKTILFIKDMLEEWVNIKSSTKHNYKRSIYYTFILTIQQDAKG